MVALAQTGLGHDDSIGAGLVGRGVGAFSGSVWHAFNRTICMAAAEKAQFVGRYGHASAPAHVEAFVCQPFASVKQRLARSARVVGPRQHQYHTGLHTTGFSAFVESL